MDKIVHEVKCICLQDKKKGPKLLLFQTSLKEEMIIVTSTQSNAPLFHTVRGLNRGKGIGNKKQKNLTKLPLRK